MLFAQKKLLPGTQCIAYPKKKDSTRKGMMNLDSTHARDFPYSVFTFLLGACSC